MISLAVSPCSNPDLTLDAALAAYAEVGFSRFELFTSWCKSAADPTAEPEEYLRVAAKLGFKFSSIHIPPIGDDIDAGIALAARTCRLGAALGCRAALVKAKSRELYIAAAQKFLNVITGIPIIPVLQNHAGSPISSLDDYREVLGGIDDPRMKCTLEVGHFHSVGVPWSEGYELLRGRIELVHIKDQVGAQSVPFGAGEIDLPGLFARLKADGYNGDVVIEMEVADRENTLTYLEEAFAYVGQMLGG